MSYCRISAVAHDARYGACPTSPFGTGTASWRFTAGAFRWQSIHSPGCGGGNGYLAVWTDTRSVFATMAETFARRAVHRARGWARCATSTPPACWIRKGTSFRAFPVATTGIVSMTNTSLPSRGTVNTGWCAGSRSRGTTVFLTEIIGVRIAPDGAVVRHDAHPNSARHGHCAPSPWGRQRRR